MVSFRLSFHPFNAGTGVAKRLLTPFLISCAPTIAALLFSLGAYAQTSTQSQNVETKITAEIFQPYLGKWRPTSYQRQLNVGSITVTEIGFSRETGGSVSYEVVKKTDEGVIVRVTDRRPPDVYSEVTAFGFSLETETVDSFPPGGSKKTREILRICQGSGNFAHAIERLVLEMKSRRCPYTLIR